MPGAPNAPSPAPRRSTPQAQRAAGWNAVSAQRVEPRAASQTPEVQAWARLLRAHAALTRRFSADLQATHGLGLNAYEVLLHLAHAPERRMRRVDLAGSILLTASGI